jgi:hypothetical protein
MVHNFFYAFCRWSDQTILAKLVRTSVWAFPSVETVHLLALGILGGIVLLLNLRLLGVSILRDEPLPSIARSTWRALLISLGVMLVSGYALFSSEAMKDFFNWGFRLKMASLLTAIIFTLTIHRRFVLTNDENLRPGLSRVVAIVSLLLWLTVGLGGRSIGYITGYTH